jgi:fructose-bisphosphate aldolase, class I
MPATDRVKQILSNYASDNPGTLTNLYRLMNAGQLAGTGKLVILPVDQGFEHGPARSFAPNPEGYDPDYHYQLAIDAGCSAYAAPLGALEAGAAKFAGQIPLILKLNNSDTLAKVDAPCSAITGSIEDALRLGCVGIGYTIYPGSSARNRMYEDLRELTLEAKRKGLVVVTWSYPRGAGLSKAGETGVDVCAYAAHIAAQLGAHIIKVKPPTAHIELEESKKALANVKLDTLADRARYVVQASFNGKRIVIFSGGEAKGYDDVVNEVRELARGGAFGSIMGRNAFQRPRAEALKLLGDVMGAFRDPLAGPCRRPNPPGRPSRGLAGWCYNAGHDRYGSPGHGQRRLVPRHRRLDHRHGARGRRGAAGTWHHGQLLWRAAHRGDPDTRDDGASVPGAGHPQGGRRQRLDGGRLAP